MFLKYKTLTFLTTLILGTLISVSSSSWFSAWLGLEINLMSMAPILIYNYNSKSIEAAIKYFIFQALASIILVFFIFIPPFFFHLTFLSNSIISLSLIIKTGMAPFQFWFPQIMECSNWNICLIILTWQKIAPLTLLSFTSSNFLFMSIIFSTLTGALGGINQSNLKILLTYSSLIHTSWMFSLILINSSFWVFYMFMYFFLNMAVVIPFFKFDLTFFNSIFLLKNMSPTNNFFILNFFSLAGLPPFFGFSLKLISMILLLKSNIAVLIIFTLIISSLISFYFYVRLTFSALFNSNHLLFKHFTSPKNNSTLTLYSIISVVGNGVLPVVSLLT